MTMTSPQQTAPATLHPPATLPAFARHAEHPVDAQFVNRWSPRSFKSDPVPHRVLESMVEAARWAPSSANLQPWRFYISGSHGAQRDAYNEAVNPSNRIWSDKAPVLVFVVARKSWGPNPMSVEPSKANRHAFFDTGMATIQFVLEAEKHGLRAHMMGGIDLAKAHALLGLDDDNDVVCAIAIGYQGPADQLGDGHRAREKPSDRKPTTAIAHFA